MNRLHVRSPPLLSCFFPRLLIMSKASSPVKCLPPWAHELGLLFVLIWRELFGLLMDWLRSRSVKPSSKKATNDMKKVVPRVEDLAAETNILDLPELALECILGKLSPEGLLEMACVCRCMRERCRSDHVWERHMRKRWGRLMGGAARRQWELYAASRKEALEGSVVPVEPSRPRGLMGSLSCVWPPSWFRSNFAAGSSPNNTSLVNSTMHWYLALESGRFWFPAQVFNRENGHLGFMLSCYDAELSYDRHSDTFYARYPPHGCRLVNVEEGVLWDRIRVPSVATPYDLHVSDCLSELSPGDHIEIQWRRNKQFPYGWWYGVIGHLESCDENWHNCLCHKSDTIILEFKQYAPGTRWRQAVVNRKNHLEEGNEMNGFYGGIRKLNCKDEVSMWRQHWPTETL